jgi:hypothetical protein
MTIGKTATRSDWRERRGEACLASGDKPNRPAMQDEPFVELPRRVPSRHGDASVLAAASMLASASVSAARGLGFGMEARGLGRGFEGRDS